MSLSNRDGQVVKILSNIKHPSIVPDNCAKLNSLLSILGEKYLILLSLVVEFTVVGGGGALVLPLPHAHTHFF